MTAHREVWTKPEGTHLWTRAFWVEDGIVEVSDDREVPAETWRRYLSIAGWKPAGKF